MRGSDNRQQPLFSYVTLEQRVPADHPLRPVRLMVDEALQALSPLFDQLYAKSGRPSIAPERLLRALLLQLLYSVRSERMLMEQLDYNLLFRWFVGLTPDEAVWDATTFTKNRDRLLEGEVAREFFAQVLTRAGAKGLVSNEHFTVDGTLLEAWASHKSFVPMDASATDERAPASEGPKDEPPPPPDDPGNPTVVFKGRKRSNQTHRSTTDPDARLYKKSEGKPAQLCYLGHALMENRNGLVVDARVTLAGGRAEWEAALDMLAEVGSGLDADSNVTVGADKGYDTREFVAGVQSLGIAPHVARHATRYGGSAVPACYEEDAGYLVSQRKRKLVEEIFSWMKTVGSMRKLRHRGRQKVAWMFTLAAAAYNLVRMRRLLACA